MFLSFKKMECSKLAWCYIEKRPENNQFDLAWFVNEPVGSVFVDEPSMSKSLLDLIRFDSCTAINNLIYNYTPLTTLMWVGSSLQDGLLFQLYIIMIRYLGCIV